MLGDIFFYVTSYIIIITFTPVKLAVLIGLRVFTFLVDVCVCVCVFFILKTIFLNTILMQRLINDFFIKRVGWTKLYITSTDFRPWNFHNIFELIRYFSVGPTNSHAWYKTQTSMCCVLFDITFDININLRVNLSRGMVVFSSVFIFTLYGMWLHESMPMFLLYMACG